MEKEEFQEFLNDLEPEPPKEDGGETANLVVPPVVDSPSEAVQIPSKSE